MHSAILEEKRSPWNKLKPTYSRSVSWADTENWYSGKCMWVRQPVRVQDNAETSSKIKRTGLLWTLNLWTRLPWLSAQELNDDFYSAIPFKHRLWLGNGWPEEALNWLGAENKNVWVGAWKCETRIMVQLTGAQYAFNSPRRLSDAWCMSQRGFAAATAFQFQFSQITWLLGVLFLLRF